MSSSTPEPAADDEQALARHVPLEHLAALTNDEALLDNIYVSNPSPETLRIRWDDLNYLVTLGEPYISPAQQQCLQLILAKLSYEPLAFNHPWPNQDSYPDFAALMVCVFDAKAEPFAKCRSPIETSDGRVFPHGTCKKRIICGRCSFQRKLNLWDRYLNAYTPGNYAFLTLSIKEPLPLGYTADYSPCDVWDAQLSALKEAADRGLITGYISSEEVGICSLYPDIRVRPHVHAVIRVSHGVTVEDFRELLTSHLSHDLMLGDDPFSDDIVDLVDHGSPHLIQLKSREDFKNALGYLIKPIQVLDTYRRALSEAGAHRTTMVNLNTLMLFEHIWNAIYEQSGGSRPRIQTRCAGRFHGCSSEYVGDRDHKQNRKHTNQFIRQNLHNQPNDLS